MEAPTLIALGTTAGLAAVTLLIVQLIWKTAQPSPEIKDRFGPLTAVVVGTVLALIAVYAGNANPAGANGTDIVNALLSGLFVGTTSMGIHDSIDSVNPDIV